MRMLRSSILLATTLALALAAVAYAADAPPATGSVSGTLMLKDGKTPAAGATVKVLAVAADKSHDPAEVQSLTAAQDGTFKAANLAPGGYILKFASGDQLGNKSARVVAGKDTPIGKVTLKPATNTGKKSEPKDPPPPGKKG